jgi:hypothetical protein
LAGDVFTGWLFAASFFAGGALGGCVFAATSFAAIRFGGVFTVDVSAVVSSGCVSKRPGNNAGAHEAPSPGPGPRHSPNSA